MRFVIIVSLILGWIWPGSAGAADLYGKVYDTLRGEIYRDVRIVLGSSPPRETKTDDQGQYWLKDVAPGAYLIRIVLPGKEVIGRIAVSTRSGNMIVNLDVSKIEAPDSEDAY